MSGYITRQYTIDSGVRGVPPIVVEEVIGTFHPVKRYYYKGVQYRDLAAAKSAQEADKAAARQARRKEQQVLRMVQQRPQPQPQTHATQPQIKTDYSDIIKSSMAELQSKILDIVQKQQSYATQIMDKLVSKGLETIDWQKQKQEELFATASDILEEARKPVSEAEVRALSEAGTQGVLEAQKQALARSEAALAARGLLGSSASEAAYARIASQSGTQIAKLQSAAMQTALQRKHEAQMETIRSMAAIVQGSPIASSLAELAKAGLLASQFAVPQFSF